jgi:hypothetical protein
MAEFDDDRKVVMIKGRMRRLGLDLDRYIGQITNTWPRPGTPQVPPLGSLSHARTELPISL